MDREIIFIDNYRWKDCILFNIIFILLNILIGFKIYFFIFLIVGNTFYIPLMTKTIYYYDCVQFNYFYQSIPKIYYYSELKKIYIFNPMYMSKSMRFYFKDNKRIVLYYNPKLEGLLEILKNNGVIVQDSVW